MTFGFALHARPLETDFALVRDAAKTVVANLGGDGWIETTLIRSRSST
jgi:hypothetical protein